MHTNNHSPPIRVMLFEANPAYRTDLIHCLERSRNVKLISFYSNFWEAEQRIQAANPHVLLLDLEVTPHPPFPALNKILTLKQKLRDQCPAIIVLSKCIEDERIFQTHCADSHLSFLVKPCDPSELLSAVDLAAAGGVYSDDYIAQRSRELLGNPINRANAKLLTRREFTALTLLKAGYTQKETAEKMGIKSVNDTLKVIYKKLGVHNQREAENKVWFNHLEILHQIEEWRN